MRRKSILAIGILVLFLAGCTTISTPPDNPAHTALQKAKLTSLYFLETYKAQYRDAQSMAAMATAGKLAPGQLEVYRTKRALLIQAEPLIIAYDALVAKGTIPPTGREQEINDILNQLLATSYRLGG